VASLTAALAKVGIDAARARCTAGSADLSKLAASLGAFQPDLDARKVRDLATLPFLSQRHAHAVDASVVYRTGPHRRSGEAMTRTSSPACSRPSTSWRFSSLRLNRALWRCLRAHRCLTSGILAVLQATSLPFRCSPAVTLPIPVEQLLSIVSLSTCNLPI